MSDQFDKSAPGDDDDVLAGEYVLGVLDEATRAHVQQRRSREPAFAARLDDWQAHFSHLDADFAEERVPPAIFAQVESRLFGAPDRSGFWSNLFALRVFAASLTAALVLFVSVWVLAPQQSGDQWVASLQAQSGEGHWIVLIGSETTTLRLSALSPLTVEEKDVELWLIKDGADPVSLGILPRSGARDHVLPTEIASAIALGDTLAISLEPRGGSPTGKVTGPVLAAAPLAQI